MPKEIERKFLVKGNFRSYIIQSNHILQGYISRNPERTVRIRIKNDLGFITIKGKTNYSGTTRFEWEKPISKEDGIVLLEICEPGVINKTRHLVPEESGLIFEIDEFHGDNQGLIIAEIELPSEDSEFNKPNWLGEEVTGDTKYYNAMLSKNPYNNWNKMSTKI